MFTSRGYETSRPEDVARARRELVFTSTDAVPRKVRAYVDTAGGGILAPRFWDAARQFPPVVRVYCHPSSHPYAQDGSKDSKTVPSFRWRWVIC